MPSHVASRKRLRSASAVSFLVLFLIFSFDTVRADAINGRTTSRQSHYQVYFETGLCPVDIAEQVSCPTTLPICCVQNNAVRCCESNTSCDTCNRDVVGYEMARGSVLIGVMSLIMVLLIGTMVGSGLGRHLAWSLERRRVILAYRERMQLRRTAGKRFRDELAATEEHDLPDEVACTICCARRMDCALAPCGHVCCCHFCAKRLKECPVCRVTVEQCYGLPAYLVSRLVGSLEAADEGDAFGTQGGHVAPGVMEEMREMRGSAAMIEDEREMPGLLSIDDTEVSSTVTTPLKSTHETRKVQHKRGYQRTSSVESQPTLSPNRVRDSRKASVVVAPGAATYRTAVHADKSSDDEDDDSDQREYHVVNRVNRPQPRPAKR